MGTDYPSKEKSRFSGTLRLEKIMISVLSGLNDISHFWTIYPFHSNHIFCTLDHFLNMHVNYGITVGLEIHKNWNNFNWKLPELLQAYLFLPKLKFRILLFKLFHIFIVEGIKESLVEDSLQKGKIISFPFLNGYTDVRCMVGGINGVH
jgi:hypothetical protein